MCHIGWNNNTISLTWHPYLIIYLEFQLSLQKHAELLIWVNGDAEVHIRLYRDPGYQDRVTPEKLILGSRFELFLLKILWKRKKHLSPHFTSFNFPRTP